MLPIDLATKLRDEDHKVSCFGYVTHMLDNPNRVDVVDIIANGKANEEIARISYRNDGSINVKGNVQGIVRALRLAHKIGLTGGPIDSIKVRP